MDNQEEYIDSTYLKNVNGILLDFDGTIVPSEKIFVQVWQDVFKSKFQCPFTTDEYLKYELEEDSKLIDFLITSNRLDKKLNRNVIMQDVYAAYMLEFKKMLDENDSSEILAHIAKWNSLGIKVSIVSTSRKCYIDLFLKKYEKYRGIFTCVLCREDVEKLKPDPAVYLKALSEMKLLPSQCLVIEDSYKGIKGAQAVGARVVRVTENTFYISKKYIYNVPTVKSILDL